MTWALTREQRSIRAKACALAREVIAPRAADVDRSEQYPSDRARAVR